MDYIQQKLHVFIGHEFIALMIYRLARNIDINVSRHAMREMTFAWR